MKKYLAIALLMFACNGLAMAWDCKVPGQVRVQVPTGTIGNGVGDGDGQVVVDSGLTFICEKLPTATTTPPSSSTSTSGANSTSGATATGGNSKSTSSVGPITNTNTNNLSNKQNQTQTQSNASTNNNASSATGNGDNSNNSSTTVEAPKIPVNTAMAPPVFSTANCYKGFSGGGQTAPLGLSFGGGSIDKNCAALMTAQNLYAMGSRLSACKVIITTKAAKAAGVTLEDCMTIPVAPKVYPRDEPTKTGIPAPIVAPTPIVVTPVVVTPQILYVPEYHQMITVTPPVKKRIVYADPQKKVAPKAAPKKPVCVIPPSLKTPLPR